MNLNARLLKIVGFSWLAFLITGLAISRFFTAPTLTVLIDRSYCPAQQWRQVSQTYTDLYRQHQRHQLHLQKVVLFSDLGQESFASPPLPTMIQNLATYGQFDGQRQARLQKDYAKTRLLSCQSSGIYHHETG